MTGAGCSTESNIPDYRGPNGAYSTGFKPMTHQQVPHFLNIFESLSLQPPNSIHVRLALNGRICWLQFMASPRTRARYWARSFAGWQEFSSIKPNAAHEAISRLQQRGWLGEIITQVKFFGHLKSIL